ncbi:hypothetical protein QBC44DRAFT_391593 [Cladorrhinum sp. PSN332]|nr:hypothetical protein QBC44DRAFT_391593 [Cladorrhinum sp. PSN332]
MEFTNLPPEINLLILSSIASPIDLACILKSSSHLWRLYLANKHAVLKSLILTACPGLKLTAQQLTVHVITNPKIPYNPDIPRLVSSAGRLEFGPIGPDPSFMSHKYCTEVFLAMGPYRNRWVRMPSYERAMADPNRSLTLKRARYFVEVEWFRPAFEDFMDGNSTRDTQMKCLECGQRTGMYFRGNGWPVCVRENVEMKRLPMPKHPIREVDSSDDEDPEDSIPLMILLNKMIVKNEAITGKTVTIKKEVLTDDDDDMEDSDDSKPLILRCNPAMLKKKNEKPVSVPKQIPRRTKSVSVKNELPIRTKNTKEVKSGRVTKTGKKQARIKTEPGRYQYQTAAPRDANGRTII